LSVKAFDCFDAGAGTRISTAERYRQPVSPVFLILIFQGRLRATPYETADQQEDSPSEELEE
jgi:hypothetical protein